MAIDLNELGAFISSCDNADCLTTYGRAICDRLRELNIEPLTAMFDDPKPLTGEAVEKAREKPSEEPEPEVKPDEGFTPEETKEVLRDQQEAERLLKDMGGSIEESPLEGTVEPSEAD